MGEFDRKATILAELAGLDVGDLNDITGLAVSGGDREELLEEVRDTVRDAYETGLASNGAEVWANANIVPHQDGERLRYFTAVDAAQRVTLADLSADRHAPLLDVLAAALDFVYSAGVDALVKYLEDEADRAEQAHEDAEDEHEGGDGVPGGDPQDWV